MKISIITVSFNSENTIEETIRSIIKNKNKYDIEYIIIDGKSTDKTCDIINKYLDCIDYYVSEKDNGISDAFNKGLKVATGDLIGIINSDDVLNDDAIYTLINNTDSSDIYYGNIIGFDNNSSKVIKPQKLSKIKKGMPIFHPAVFVKKKVYDEIGGFDMSYKCCMDRDFLLRAFNAKYIFKYIDSPLVKYRYGGTNQKYFKKTCNESYQISVKNGNNKFISFCVSKKDYYMFIIKRIIKKILRRA